MRTMKQLFQMRRMSAYKNTFSNPEGQKVLADLARFCRALEPTADVSNPNVTYLLEGRREVFLRILAHLKLDVEDIATLKENYDE